MSGLDEQALEATVARSEEIARSAPENRELLPPVGPQTYAAGAGYDAPTAVERPISRFVGTRYRAPMLRQGSGEPLVLFHGILGSERMWAHVVSRLAAHHDTVAPTALGHRTGNPASVRPEDVESP